MKESVKVQTTPLILPEIDLRNYSPKNIPAIDQARIMEYSAFEDFIAEWF